jgi:membrane protease YdiL (CAAX protease family)
VSWTIFLVPLLSKEGLGVFHYDAPPVQVFALLASVIGLAGSAFTVTALVDGRAGVRALASRLVRWRVGLQWYLVAFFGLPVVALVGISVVYGVAPIAALPRQWSALIGYLVQVLLVAALVNLWEETGWTGFMFTRLQPRFGALVACLLVSPYLESSGTGARGYVLKGGRPEEILRAIQAVGGGEAIFSPSIATRMLDFFSGLQPAAFPHARPN